MATSMDPMASNDMDLNEEEMDDDPLMGEGLRGETESLAAEGDSNNGQKQRVARTYSKCWVNFIKIGDKLPNGESRVCCKHCKTNFSINLSKSGTNTMRRHSTTCSKTPGSTPSSSVRRPFDNLIFREMITVAIIRHNLPYSFVEYTSIREAFSYANPEIEFWSRNTAAADVLKVYEKEKVILKQSLSQIPGRVCLTTDLWRAITMEGYICLTAHYIDVDWVLKTKILSFSAFPPPHTGNKISLKLIELLKDWGLEKKIFSLTVDNAFANDSMQGILKRQIHKDLVCNGEFFHVRCSAHILNLIVQDGLAIISVALEKIRETVRFVKSSESREEMFLNCMETVGVQSKSSLVFDVKTRWNSTHRMLSRAIMFKEVLRNLRDMDSSYESFPSDEEWERAERIFRFLTPFAEMTNLISGSSYPTANLYFMQVWEIES